MDHIKLWLKNNYLTVLVFIGIFIVIFWQIGNCPNILDDYVEFEVHPQVNKVFDHLVVPGEITWDWVQMYQGQGGRSPIYGGLIELGLRLFGLTLFGIRIFPALLGFLVLLFTYYTMTKFYPKNLGLLFVVLLSTTPWYLSMIRAGGLAGFSLSLGLLALSAVALLLKNEAKGIWIAILAGISVAILPYGYMILRPLYLLLIAAVILSIGRVKGRNLILFLICFLAISSLQFHNLPNAKYVFFYARGESIYTSIGPNAVHRTDLNSLLEKVKSNTVQHLNFLLGLNQLSNFWNPNIAYAFWMSDMVFYPRFLVPFFILGFLICLVGFVIKPSWYYLVPFVFFGLGLIPGTMSFWGEPNMSRSSLLVVPLYFFIAFSLYQIGHFIYKRIPPEATKRKTILTSVVVAIVIGIISFQVWNFFGYANQRGERGFYDNRAYPYLTEYFKKNPQGKIIYHGIPPFEEYGAYVFLRVLGGKPLAEKIAAGNLIFVKTENLGEINELIYDKSVDLVVAAAPEKLLQNVPIMSNYTPEDLQNGLFVYHIK